LAAGIPGLTLDLPGAPVQPEAEAIGHSILGSAAVDYFRQITVKLLRTVLDPEPGREPRVVRVVCVPGW
jgi:hypothetical protein